MPQHLSREDMNAFSKNNDEHTFEKKILAILNDPTVTPWPFVEGAEAKAFAHLQAELNKRFGISLWKELNKLNQSQLDVIKNGTKPSDPKAWKVVISTVETALADITTIQDFFQGQKIFLLGSQTIIYETAQQTIDYVGIEKKDPPQRPFPLSALLSIILAPLSLVPSGIGSAAAGIITGAIGFVNGSSNFSDQQKINDFKLTSLQFESQLSSRFSNFFDAINQVLNTAASDYGKLTQLAKLLNSPQVKWPNEKSLVSKDGMIELEVGLWKFFLPARWPLITLTYSAEIIDGVIAAATQKEAEIIADEKMKEWPQSYWDVTGGTLINGFTHELSWKVSIYVLAESSENKHRCNPRLSDGSAERLFSILKVQRKELFLQQNGWTGFKTEEVNWPYSQSAKWVLGE